MARSGPARGISAIRKALTEYVAMEPTIQLTTRRVVQAGNTALLVADWRFHGTATRRRSTASNAFAASTAQSTPPLSFAVCPPPHVNQAGGRASARSEEHTSELQSRRDLVCRLLLE